MKILLSAYQCAPGAGSVSQIGWEWYRRMAERVQVTLVTHIRNRAALEAAGAPSAGREVIYIDTEWFAAAWYKMARRLFPRSEHSVFLLSSADYFLYEASALRRLRARRGEWDVIHAVTPVSPSAASALGWLGAPLVRGPLNGGLRTPAGFPAIMGQDSAWLYRLRGVSRPLRALTAAAAPADVVLCANDATAAQLAARERDRVLRMPEIAVDERCFTATPWPQPPAPGNPLRVLFAGRLIPAKALPLLFDAVRGLPADVQVEITVAGDGPMREEWTRAAGGLGSRVRFLGACTQPRLAELMRGCHLFCLPSVRESGGAVLLEAMASARPVLAVAHGGPAVLVTPECGVLVDAASPAAVVEGLRAALLDCWRRPERWRRMGGNGRRTALLRHTWESRIEQALKLYPVAA